MELNSLEKPAFTDVSNYINNNSFNKLCIFIEEKYNVNPSIEFSKCSMAFGWNVKYKKGSKSICVIYPNVDYCTCLVSMSDKFQSEVEVILPIMSEYVQGVYKNTKSFNGSRWLMIDITNDRIVEDVEKLISIKI